MYRGEGGAAIRQWPVVTFTIAALTLAAAPLAPLLQYDREMFDSAGSWGFVTGHFVHWSATHLLWNLAAFLILGAICERETPRWLLATTIAATAGIVSTFLFVFCPEVARYRGLSAIDSALFLFAAVLVGQRKPTLAFLCVGAFVGKLIIEITTGAPLFVDAGDDVRILPSVHLIGAAIGFCAAVAQHKIVKCRASTSTATPSPSMTAA